MDNSYVDKCYYLTINAVRVKKGDLVKTEPVFWLGGPNISLSSSM